MRLSRVFFGISALFLWSLVLQAPLRYGFAQLHLDMLIYLPKLLLLVTVVLLPLLRSRASPPALMVTGLVGAYLVWGAMNLSSPAQAAFGLWVLVPLLFGVWVGNVTPQLEQWRRLFAVLFVAVVAGVFLNLFIHYPWSGQIVNIAGKSFAISREWGTFGGFDRYSGFASVSFNAASQLLLLSVIFVALLKRNNVKLLVWFIAGAGIALTTSKGPMGAWLLVSVYFYGGKLLRWPWYWRQLWLGVLTLIFLSMILLPLSTLCIRYHPNLHGFISNFIFKSFGLRLDETWPGSLHLLNLEGAYHWLVGRGLGGIGSAQKYFEMAHFWPADNLFVYVTVLVGLPMSLFLFVSLWWRIVVFVSSKDAPVWYLPFFLALIAYGVVINVIEEPALAFFLGLALGTPKRKTVTYACSSTPVISGRSL